MPRNPPPHEDKPLPPPPPPKISIEDKHQLNSFLPLPYYPDQFKYSIPLYLTHKMTMHDFVYWLRGYFELENPTSLNEEQVKKIKEHLDMVFVESDTPKYYGSC